MINKISQTQTTFTGLRLQKLKRCADEAYIAIKNRIQVYDGTEAHTSAYRAYAQVIESPKAALVEKKIFGFGTKDSIPVKPYNDCKAEFVGFSTEGEGGYGGGWIKANLGTPLSTANIHTCAAINLIDKSNNKHFLYHVYHGTTPDDIEKFLLQEFPTFDTVNIIPGDNYGTKTTVNNIITALDNINQKAQRRFYHFSTEAPEIVAHNGEFSYIERKNNYDEMTFTEVGNNFSAFKKPASHSIH